MTPARSLFSRLFDNAALFPPAKLPMDEALRGHERHLAAWYAKTVGPFVCPVAAVDGLLGHLSPAAEPLEVALLITGGPEAITEGITGVAREPRLRLAAVEVAVDGPPGAALAASAHSEHLPEAVPIWIEIPYGDPGEAIADQIAAAGHRAKLRTGGTVAGAFPQAATLARSIRAFTQRSIPFKCTAGLHSAVRHTDPRTGFEHHGILNLLLATEAAVAGAGPGDVEALLEERDEAAVIRAVRGSAGLGSARTAFRSFGTCSIDEPIEDLVRLGLLEPPSRPGAPRP